MNENLAFVDQTANCLIRLPQSGYYFLSSYTTCTIPGSTPTCTATTTALSNGTTVSLPAEHNVILDVSSYSTLTGHATPVPLGNLLATSTGHLTISGSAVLYTDTDMTAVEGQHTNHLTIDGVTFNRDIYIETVGTVTGISAYPTTTANGLTVLPYVTVSTPSGFRTADLAWQDDHNYIAHSHGITHTARYMRLYDASNGQLLPNVTSTSTTANQQVPWGESPDSYNSSQAACETIAGSIWDPIAAVCEVPPSITPGAGTFTCTPSTCNIYIKSSEVPPQYVIGAFVCFKTKMSGPYSGGPNGGQKLPGGSIAYRFTGPWDAVDGNNNPLDYGGFDVTLGGDSWYQQAYGFADHGFRSLNVISGNIERAPPPQPSSPNPCLTDGNGGPQLGAAGENEMWYQNNQGVNGSWPPTVTSSQSGKTVSTVGTIGGLIAIATGDDTIALFSQSPTSVMLLSNHIASAFARGIFINNNSNQYDPVICSNGGSWTGTICTLGGIPLGTAITSAPEIDPDDIVTSNSDTLYYSAFSIGGTFAPNGQCIGPPDFC